MQILHVRNVVIDFRKDTVSIVLRSLVDQGVQRWGLNIAFICRVLRLLITGNIVLIAFKSLLVRCQLIGLKPVVLHT